MKEYIVGLDGGGTKTLARVLDLDTRATLDVTGAGTNLCGTKEAQVRAALTGLLRSAMERAGGAAGCKAVALGAAGCSREGVAEKLTAFLREAAPREAVLCVKSDLEIAVRGALPPGPGLVLNAGTGSFAAGRDEQGRFFRAGGGGHLLDDEGSGYALGRDGLRHLLRTMDGREAPDALSQAIADAFRLRSPQDVITYAYESDKGGVAAVAPVVVRCLEAGDSAAKAICGRGVLELLKLFEAVRRQTRLRAGQVVLLGGMMEHHKVYRALLLGKLTTGYPGWQTCGAAGTAVDGAVELALQSLLHSASKGEDPHRKPPD